MDRKSLLGVLVLALIVLAATPRALAVCEPVFGGPTTVADLGLNNRAWGIAAGDFDRDGHVDVVAGRSLGQIFFIRGNGDGTFAAASQYAWKQAAFNAWAFSAADVDGDGKLDIVWGSSANSPSTAPFVVNDGEVRVFYGNGDGTFVQNPYTISGVLHNAGSLLADIGTRAATVTAGDIDGDGDGDVVVGGIDGTDTVVKILRNNGGGVFSIEELIRMAISIATPATPIYFPPPSSAAASQTLDRPWGLALGDADGDGDLDLFVADRAFYVYLYVNNGAGVFTLQGGNTTVAGRPNVYLAHDAFRPAVGYTLSLAAGDVNGDAKADLVLGLLNEKSGGTLSGLAHDGEILLDTSKAAGGHASFGLITGADPASDAGSSARGVAVADVNNDGLSDAILGTWEGPVKLYLAQAPSTTACDDTNPCTLDTCVGGACAHAVEPDHAACDDGLYCTVNDECLGGTCISGPARDCGDAVDCTLDGCSETAGCEHTTVDGACNDGNACTADTCDAIAGCSSVPLDTGTPCSDGNACTVGDLCDGGKCIPGEKPLLCDDANVCTDDVCDPAIGCVSTPNTATCDDGSLCTTGDTCQNGACVGASHANEPGPKSSGYFKRLCQGPHLGDQLTSADVGCVNDAPNFAAVSDLDDLCFILEGMRDDQYGACKTAESELMTLALNRCRARACDASSILSDCGDPANTTVAESFTEAAGLILDPAERTDAMCLASTCLTREISDGHAFKLDTVQGDRSSADGIVLTWEEPYLGGGAVHPTRYDIYRLVLDDPDALFIKIGETEGLTFTDETPGSFEYEIVPVAPEAP